MLALIAQACTYSCISDAELNAEVKRIKRSHPNDGERLMMGHLATSGILVQRSRLQSAIHRVDPENTAIRRNLAIRRRTYHVDGPNSMWHIDSHHKLIRWKFVTHGGINGYSRTITFLKCADNNRAYTALSAFMNTIYVHGLPECVRMDLGGENVEIYYRGSWWNSVFQQQLLSLAPPPIMSVLNVCGVMYTGVLLSFFTAHFIRLNMKTSWIH